MEAYAAFALRAWLSSSPVISDWTRRFARWSAMGSLLLGMAGQVAYHLLTEALVTRAPWQVTTLVSCLPVLVLGMGTALAHLVRGDASAASGWQDSLEPAGAVRTSQRGETRRSLPCGTVGRPSLRTGNALVITHGDRWARTSSPATCPADYLWSLGRPRGWLIAHRSSRYG